MNIYVITLNWNGKEDTLHCLESLKHMVTPHTVVIVDNGSTDDSVETISKAYPNYHLIETGENLGYAEGNNIGIQYALDQGASHLLILNNDTIVTTDFLENFLKRDLPIQGGKGHLMEEPFILDLLGGNWNSKTGKMEIIGRRDSPAIWTKPIILDYISGAAMFIKAELFNNVGLFDPTFFLIWEEVDWCFRAKKLGYPSYVCPEAIYFHKKSASFNQRGHTTYFWWRNQLLFLEKNFSRAVRKKWTKAILKESFECFKVYLHLFFRHLFFQKNKKCTNRFIYCKSVYAGVRDYLLRRFGNCPSWILKSRSR